MDFPSTGSWRARAPHERGRGTPSLLTFFARAVFLLLGSFYFSLANVLRQGWLRLGATSSPSITGKARHVRLSRYQRGRHMASLGVAAVDLRSVLRCFLAISRIDVDAIESFSYCRNVMENVGVVSDGEKRLTYNGRDAR